MSLFLVVTAVIAVLAVPTLAAGLLLVRLSRPPARPQPPCTHSRIRRPPVSMCDDTVLDGKPYRVAPYVGTEGSGSRYAAADQVMDAGYRVSPGTWERLDGRGRP